MDGINLEHYDNNFEMRHLLRKLRSVTVRHHQTCQFCGRVLINVYYRDPGEVASPLERQQAWKCKKCWDEIDQKNQEFDAKLKELIEEEV